MKIVIIFLLFAQSVSCLPIDSNIFKYFPLKIGNRWTWHGFAYPIMPPPNVSQKIISTILINNHLYYFSKLDQFQNNGTIQHTSYNYCRIDSLTGNLYTYDTVSHTDCIMDSLNIRKNDSAYSCGGKWYRCEDTANYNIFNLNIKSKSFYWTNYFEGGDRHILVLGIGRVRTDQYGAQFSTGHTLQGCLINGVLYGDTSLVSINQISTEIPENFSLSQNYPNPFNPATHIGFRIADFGLVRIIVYDALGREVQTLVNQELQPGTYEVDFDGSNLPSGVYYYKLESESFTETKKMVLLK
ncbi:MAG: T9SS type A sorting domain-containing protein [Ignavibacteria bacterium]|nr:T9SS type A sorting domain-containing protein [Ignavibacteria bacterium]